MTKGASGQIKLSENTFYSDKQTFFCRVYVYTALQEKVNFFQREILAAVFMTLIETEKEWYTEF